MEQRYRESEGADQLDLWPDDDELPSKGRVIRFIVAAIGCFALYALLVVAANAQEQSETVQEEAAQPPIILMIPMPRPCIAPDTPQSVVQFGGEPTEQVAHLKGEHATEFTEAYNAWPPQSQVVADEVIVHTHKSSPHVYIQLFSEGCLSGESAFNGEAFNGIMDKIGAEGRKIYVPAKLEQEA